MTAIVGVLNKHPVAIAADSAVTLGDISKKHLEDYAYDFIEYLKNQDFLVSEEVQRNNLFSQIFSYY